MGWMRRHKMRREAKLASSWKTVAVAEEAPIVKKKVVKKKRTRVSSKND